MIKAASCQPPKNEVESAQKLLIHVLHVDDNEDFLICFKRYLETRGSFKVESALSVKEAMEKIGQKSFDVIISDQQMPKKSGTDFLKSLRAEGNETPFFLLTGDHKIETLTEVLNQDVYRVFNKDDEPEKLYAELVHSIKQSLKSKNESENKFRAITSSARDGIILIDNEGKIVYWNNAAEKIFGYTKDEIVGKNLHALIAPKPFHDKYKKGFEAFKQTGAGSAIGKTLEFDGIKKDGKTIPIEVSVSSVKLNGKWNAFAIVRDCTERKEAWTSLEATINELEKINEKLNVVGRLTRHDARNKLSVILNNIYLAKQSLNKQQDTNVYLHNIESLVDQLTKIFDFASTYEKLGIEELTYMNVEKIFNEASMLVSGPQNVKYEIECSGLNVLADSLLRQLFYNFIHNSLAHGETVNQIKTYCQEETENLKLIYEDNGSGIPENEKERIFKEGYGKGTGFGLYLIRKICEAYGWTIHESGTFGKGAKFVITIPKTKKDGKTAYYFEQSC